MYSFQIKIYPVPIQIKYDRIIFKPNVTHNQSGVGYLIILCVRINFGFLSGLAPDQYINQSIETRIFTGETFVHLFNNMFKKKTTKETKRI